MRQNLACFIYGRDVHYVDHLAPLAHFLDIPLITNDVDVDELVKTFYPNVQRLFIDTLEIDQNLLENYTSLISCMPSAYMDAIFSFAKKRTGKTLKYIFCPHGHSDKKNLSALKKENHLLLYGTLFKSRLPPSPKKQTYFLVGNYRKQYFEKHKEFYKKLIEDDLPIFKKEKKTVFYAPTWEDREKGFCLKRAERLFKAFPKELQLVVKFHPNTWEKRELQILSWKCNYEGSIFFLENLPVIFPFFSYFDAYIGDTSSIAYDWLLTEKPLYFFTQKRNRQIFDYGEKLSIKNLRSSLCKSAYKNNEKRRSFVEKAFAKNPCWKSLKASLTAVSHS